MAFGVGLMTPVPYPIAYALIGGLSSDSLVKHSEARQAFPEVELIDFDTATRDALEKTHPDHIERVWADGTPGTRSLKHEGCFILHHSGLSQRRRGAVATLADGGSKLPESTTEHQSTPFGEMWLERDQNSRTLFFSPRGLPGFLYWYLLYPFHWLRLRRSAKRT
jgi:hypothetical protein